MKTTIRTNRWAALGISLALAATAARAQDQGMGEMMFTAGTVTTAADGQEWAWLQWMATDGALIRNVPMDVYWKAGDATSTDPLALKGTAMQTTDPKTIALLLKRGQTLGEDLAALETVVDTLYADAHPGSGLALPEKIAALIAGSQDDPELYDNLVFLGRAHPAVAIEAIGHGFACRIPSSGFSTFEVRDHSTGEIIGRIVLEGGNPLVLPAPGPITRVVDASPKGNLNILLRWDSPDELKRLSLLQFGYSLYRVDASSATNWWGPSLAPSSTDELIAYVETYAEAVKINCSPIVADEENASSNSWFAVDNNDGLSGGTPFVNGHDYVYYVTALDLLGRDGELSAPFLTYPCDRMAPSVPHGIETRTVSEYSGGERQQWVEISWDHDTNDTDVARYYVYRFPDLSSMQTMATNPLYGRISSAIVPAPGDTRLYYEDHFLDSNDWNTTYWYTVRAEDDARCAPNLSGNSAPAFGLVRDWEGPPAASNVVVNIQSETLSCIFKMEEPKPDLDPPNNLRLTCTRPDPDSRIEWAEFSYYAGHDQGPGSETNAVALGRYYSRPGSTTVSRQFQIPVDGENRLVTVFCRVGSVSGKTSNFAHREQYITYESLVFSGSADLFIGPFGPLDGPHVWDFPKAVFPEIEIPAVPGAESYRLYRRIDGGPRTLVYQGEMDELLGALITDYKAGTVNASTLCYYYQLFDEHGNAGPMIKICCFDCEARADLPVPVLNAIEPSGEAAVDPGMVLGWFCPAPGVERFEVAVALDNGPLPAAFGDQGYGLVDGATNSLEVVVAGTTNTLAFGFYRTGRVGTAFGSAGSPLFSLPAPIDLDRDYTVMVRAIGPTGTVGGWSNVETFRWSTVATPGPDVPWPARPMPPVQTSTFHTNLAVHYLDDSHYLYLFGHDYVGIRIGEIPSESVGGQHKPGEFPLADLYDPVEFLYTNAFNNVNTVLPCVLYRYQVPNALYLEVGGDVAQVSPLMENIAYGKTAVTVIYDPFIVITRPNDTNVPWGIYLIDTQPVVRGAAYQYLLLRLDEDTKEIDRVIPVGTITIP